MAAKSASAAHATMRNSANMRSCALAEALQHDASMVVFRSVSVGLLLACFALLVARPAVEVRVAHDEPQPTTLALPDPGPAMPTIIDVAPGVTAMQLAATIHLAPGERIIAVDDVAVAGDLGAGLLLASRDLRSRQFIDFSVAGPEGERRVLALLH